MDAFFFTIAVFGFWVLLGRAVLTLCPTGLPALQQWFLAPAVGISTLLLPVFWLNRAGWPVKDFGVWLVIGLTLLSALALWRKPPETPRKDLVIAGLILLGALLFAAWPMFRFGFAWVSFCNDDMANYCLAADRFLNHGFFEGPNMEDFLQGKDYTQALWYAYAVGGVRPGSELILATACSFFGPKSAHQVFMPTVAALHLSLISATGAMALTSSQKKSTPHWAILFTGLSSLTILGFVYQLIAQIGGLTLLIGSACLTCLTIQKKKTENLIKILKSSLPSAILVSSLLIYYPEILPFYFIGFTVFSIIYIWLKKDYAFMWAKKTIFLCIQIVIIGNFSLYNCIHFLFSQIKGSISHIDVTQLAFPYFLIPSGLPKFWGIVGLTEGLNEPWGSIMFCVAAISSAYYLFKIFPITLRKGSICACILLGQLCLVLFLFYRKADFGLFKLSMYMQPFIWCSLAEFITEISSKRVYRILIFVFVIANLKASQIYVWGSAGFIKNFGFIEVQNASTTRLIDKLKKYFNERKNKEKTIVIKSSNIVLAKFISLYSQGHPCRFISKPFFNNLIEIGIINAPGLVKQALSNQKVIKLKNGNTLVQENFDQNLENQNIDFMSLSEIQEIQFDTDPSNSFDEIKVDKKYSNQLVLKESNYGRLYYVVGKQNRKNISVFKLEQDIYFPNSSFCALGEHILFQVIAPHKKARIQLDLSTTPLATAGVKKMPKIKLNDTLIIPNGNGAGRIISNPIKWEQVDGSYFLSVDMSNQAVCFPVHRSCLQSLYGDKIPDDFRRITVFCRGLKILTEDMYNRLQRPSEIKNFPMDLSNQALEFSGIYEDGWLSGESFCKLLPKNSSSILRIEGIIPLINNSAFKSNISVKINGVPVYHNLHSVGMFSIKVPVDGKKIQSIEIKIPELQDLPGNDERQVGAKVEYIGFN